MDSGDAPRTVRIAIDGPSGAGKSTIAKKVASRLGFDYIDTGAMYRAVGYKMRKEGISPDDSKAVHALLEHTEIDFRNGRVFLDGEDISDRIRTPEISKAASECAEIPEVRTKLVEIQQEIGRSKNAVMDGRDIATRVFPDAQYKFFLTASPEERASRRYREQKEKGLDCNYEEVLRDVRERDYRDMHRKTDPLRKAKDAVEIDSTNLSEEETVGAILSRIHIQKEK
ncbi:MAG: (d)CMP kinase [Eubacteriales bacterium]|nr:(d)CMP kinase [Eubacteriales bacterium]